MLIPPITLAFLFVWWSVWVRSSRPCISCLPWLSLFSVGLCLCASRVAAFSWCCGALLFCCCCSVFCVVVVFLLISLWLGACGLARSFPFPPSLPLGVSWWFLVQSVFCWSPSGYLVVSATVRLSYLWYGVVNWLLSSLRSLATKASALCGALPPWYRCCSCALAPSLRYSPSCDPVSLSDTAKTAHARLLGLCCFLPPVLLPSRASALSFLAGLRLSPSPRALVLLGFVCPPCGPLSWLVLVAPPSVCFWFVLLAWPVLWFVLFVWFRCVFRPWLVSLFCVLLLVASPLVILDRYARIFWFPLHN